jgi:tripartite-type tricarboxylate transporter receptor subunit TctC
MGLPEPAGYRPDEFTPISMIGNAPYLLVVANASPYTSAQSLVTAARKGALEYSSTGSGGPHHLVGELFAQRAQLTLIHRPYKGGADALGAVMDGKVQMMLPAAILALPKMRDASIRVLATTGARRSPRIPEVPTLAEAGLEGFEADSWYVLVGPPNMAPADVRRLSDTAMSVLRDPSFIKMLAENGVDAGDMARDSIPAFLNAEARKWGDLVQALKVVPQ